MLLTHYTRHKYSKYSIFFYTKHFILLCLFLFVSIPYLSGSECMTQWSPQSIMGIDKSPQENNNRKREKDRKRTSIKAKKILTLNSRPASFRCFLHFSAAPSLRLSSPPLSVSSACPGASCSGSRIQHTGTRSSSSPATQNACKHTHFW